MILNNIFLVSRVLSIIFIFIVVFIEKRKPESTIAWVLVLIFLPYVGVFLYILLGDLFRFGIHKKEHQKLISNDKYKELLNKQVNFINHNEKLKKYGDISNLMLLNSGCS